MEKMDEVTNMIPEIEANLDSLSTSSTILCESSFDDDLKPILSNPHRHIAKDSFEFNASTSKTPQGVVSGSQCTDHKTLDQEPGACREMVNSREPEAYKPDEAEDCGNLKMAASQDLQTLFPPHLPYLSATAMSLHPPSRDTCKKPVFQEDLDKLGAATENLNISFPPHLPPFSRAASVAPCPSSQRTCNKPAFEQDDAYKPNTATAHLWNPYPCVPYSSDTNRTMYPVVQSSDGNGYAYEMFGRRNCMPTAPGIQREDLNAPVSTSFTLHPDPVSSGLQMNYEIPDTLHIWVQRVDFDAPLSKLFTLNPDPGSSGLQMNKEIPDLGAAARLIIDASNLGDIDPAAKAHIEYVQKLFGIPTMVEINVTDYAHMQLSGKGFGK